MRYQSRDPTRRCKYLQIFSPSRFAFAILFPTFDDVTELGGCK